MDAPLTIILVGENPARIAILEDGLRDAGLHAVRLADGASLLARIAAIDPDAVMIDLENPCSDRLAQMFEVSRAANRPVAMFVDQADAEAIQSSVEAGVSAFIVDGLTKARVKTILDLCISRFNAFSRLQSELAQTRSALAERKVVDRAKVILMKARNLSEENAYALLRRTAMNENKKIADVAQSVITAAALFK
jgi:two-component system, response regulator / RNA-binding antiterminator